MHCRPPKCQKRKTGCACPNAWIEFLSRTAANRRNQGLKPLSIRLMSLKYTQAKRDNEFARNPQNTACKSDTKLLCRWNSERQKVRPLAKEKADKLKLIESGAGEATKSLVPDYPLDTENAVPPDVLKAVPQKDRWLPTVERLMPNFRLLGCVEKGLYCLEERVTKAKILVRTVKETGLKNGPSRFLAFQMEARKRLKKGGIRVPRIHFYVKVENNGDWTYLYGTDPAQGTLKSIWKSIREDTELQRKISKEFVRIQKALTNGHLVHGDLHAENIVYFKNTRNEIQGLGLIDFERTSFDVRKNKKVDSNTFNMMYMAYQKGLLQQMINDGFDLPSWFTEAVTQKKDINIAFNQAERLIDDFYHGSGVTPLQDPRTITID